MMPEREALVGEDVVVWGVSDQAGDYTLDCGNGTVFGPSAISDGSYIAHICNYGAQGTFTASLTTDAGPETATVDVAVFDGAALSATDLRGVRINMAIEDGLRYLWTQQQSRVGNFPNGLVTTWENFYAPAPTSLVVLAFENQGYTLPNDNSVPTGIYEKYVVRRGLNHVIGSLLPVQLGPTPQGDDPCVGVPAGPDACDGLTVSFDPGYTLGLAMLSLAGSGALDRVNTEVTNLTENMTYGEILQRMTNALAWGQADNGCGISSGGWVYNLNSCAFDGSTVGWALLAFLDAAAAGAVVPDWVSQEFGPGFNNTLNDNGSFDYRADANPAGDSSPGPQKVGIGLQGLFWIGELAGPRVDAVATNIDSWWNGAAGGIGGNAWGCAVPGVPYPNDVNKGCAYSMFNNFKGLKLHGIQTLPNVGRPAGPGAIPANDWHEDYKDWLLANQQAPNTVGGGRWDHAMGFSAIAAIASMENAIAELILSPVALVLPDPVTFGEIGLQHCLDGVPCTDRTPVVDGDPTNDTNPVGTDHTVVARALSVNEDPIPGTTINIDILSGPNAPQNFQGVSNAQGEVQITYTSDGTAGTDEIQASIGNLTSNLLTKVWEALPQCSDGIDNDGDGDIDAADDGCSGPEDNDESDDPQLPQCSDGIDNDGDGDIDAADDGCSGPEDNDESDDPQPLKCDMDGDGDIDRDDIIAITELRGTTVPPSDPLADVDDNGLININDARGCVLRCTRQSCAVEVDVVEYNPKDPGLDGTKKEPVRPTWMQPSSQPGSSKLTISPDTMLEIRSNRESGQRQ